MKAKLLVPLLCGLVTLQSGAFAQSDAGKEQLARSLGVDPADYTMMELGQLKCRLESADSDAERRRLLESVKGYGEVPQEPSSASKEQLARQAGVDPDDFTTAELVYLLHLAEANDCSFADVARYAHSSETLSPTSAAVKAQLAQSVGVEPGEYTLMELVKMKLGESGETHGE